MPNWSPIVWILAVVAIVVIVLFALGDIHAGVITAAASWTRAT